MYGLGFWGLGFRVGGEGGTAKVSGLGFRVVRVRVVGT